MTHDFRYAIHSLVNTPAFTLVVVLTLSLGIGANTAIFSIADQLLLRLLPLDRPDELVSFENPGRLCRPLRTHMRRPGPASGFRVASAMASLTSTIR